MSHEQQAIENEISGNFDLKVEGLKICGPSCEYFEPTTDKTVVEYTDKAIAEYQVEKRVLNSTTYCIRLAICKNALKRYLNSKQISDIQKLLEGEEK